jgi:hypothetical protein
MKVHHHHFHIICQSTATNNTAMSTPIAEGIRVTHTISTIAICQSQREIEATPTDPLLPPQVGETYVIHQDVIAGMDPSVFKNFVDSISVPSGWDRGRWRLQVR